MTMHAAAAAPEETPTIPGSARGLPKTPCMSAPPQARAAPTSSAMSTRGSRTVTSAASAIWVARSGAAAPVSARRRPATTSAGEIEYWPVPTETSAASTRPRTSAASSQGTRRRRTSITGASCPAAAGVGAACSGASWTAAVLVGSA